MTGLVILTFIPFLVAIGFLIRTRAETRARVAAEARTAALQQQLDAQLRSRREWNAALAHELRSPLAAILGYGELLEDGTFGPVDERTADALQRIRFSAQHLVLLVDGVDRTAIDASDTAEPPVRVSATALIADAADAVRFDAEARDTGIRLTPADCAFNTRPADAARALTLALGAAVKVSPGATLSIGAVAAPDPRIVITGTRLNPERDDPRPADAAPLTGAGFRLLLARHAARLAGGSLLLQPDETGTVLELRLPPHESVD